jgi:hypothetical protein
MSTTYEELVARHFALRKEDLTPEALRTREKKMRIVKIFMASRRRQPTDTVGSEFSAEERARYVDEAGAASRHTRNTLRSCLSQLAGTLVLLEDEREVPPFLNARLAHLIAKGGFTVAGLAREMSIDESVLRWWTHKGLVCADQRARVILEKLESRLGVAPGYLTSLVVEKSTKQAPPRTSFGAYIAKATHLRYRFTNWPENLQMELELLTTFKTKVIPRLGRLQNTDYMWRADGRRARRQMTKGCLDSFYGFLLLPRDSVDPRMRGRGYSVEELTMSLLADPDLLYAYTEFMAARRGFVSGTLLLFCETVKMILNAECGFFAAFAEKFRGAYSAAEWDKRCAEACTFCRTFQKVNGKNARRRGRDPFEPILHFLADDDPMRPLFDLRDALRERLNVGRTPLTLAVRFRDFLAFEILLFHPLRVENLSMMKWIHNLVARPQGGWILTFTPGELKNEKWSGNEGYREVVDESLWADIEKYQKVHRSLLSGADGPFVFLPALQEQRAFSTVDAVDEERRTVTLRNDKGKRTMDISLATCDAKIHVGDRIRVKRRFDAHKMAVKNVEGLEVGETVMHAHQEKSDLWMLHPKTLSERLRDLTAAIPGPDGGPGGGFGVQAFRHIGATSYLVRNPGDFDGAADLLKDDPSTVRENYAWIEKRILQKRRRDQARQYLEDRRAEKLDEVKSPSEPKGRSPQASPTRGRPATPQKPRGG